MKHGSSSSRREEVEVDYLSITRKINGDPMVATLRNVYPGDLDKSCCDTLLSSIVMHSVGWLDQRYCSLSEAALLRAERKELEHQLLLAWKSDSFKDILDLDYLQNTTQPSTLDHPLQSQLDNKDFQQAVEAAWNVPYVGKYHVLLFNNINRAIGSDPYLNIGAVVQSSGTGKSRMMDEQAKLVFTLPINIRGTLGINLAYPPSDQSLHKYLVMTIGDPKSCKRRYMVFFRSLFSHAAKELERLYGNRPPAVQEEFACMWREHMSQPAYRQSFYAKVVELCMSNSTSTDDDDSRIFSDAQSCLGDLIQALNQRYKSTSNVKVVIYIDEAHELKNIYPYDNENRTQLDILCSALAEFHEHPMFCLLLATESALQVLAAPGKLATSERAIKIKEKLVAPLTETPFDCAPDMVISSGVLHVKDLVETTYLAKWGRPLWWTMINKKHPSEDRPLVRHNHLVDFARMKLLCRSEIDASLFDIEQLALIAVLDVLLALDFEPSREKIHNFQAKMVANHMRITYSVPQHREYFRSGYPSEPILAEAAAQQIHKYQSQNTNLDAMVYILGKQLGNSLIDLGQRGEVVVRLLLTRAYMDGVLAEHSSDSESPLIFSRGCNLIKFIKQLFSEQPANEILNSQPDNMILDATFHKKFRDSVVHFTHWVKGGDESVLTTEALFAAFARGMAFICQERQKYVDLVVPVLLDKSATLQESSMSAILVQVKRQVEPSSGIAYAFFQESIHLFPTDDTGDRPYFVLITELGGEGPQAGQEGATGKKRGGGRKQTRKGRDEKGKAKATQSSQEERLLFVSQRPQEQEAAAEKQEGRVTRSKKEKGKEKEVFIPQQPQIIRHSLGTHPRFLATVYGCSNAMYKAIPEDNSEYQQLLAFRNFLDEHPHQDDESRSAVMKLKPLWKYGEDSYGWVESEVLNCHGDH